MTEPAPSGATAIDGLLSITVGHKLYTLHAYRAAFPDGPLDPRHPAHRHHLEPLARALAGRWRVPRSRPNPGKPSDVDLRARLGTLADETGRRYRETKVEVVTAALIVALAEQDQPTRVRILRRWHDDVRPVHDLAPRKYLRWLVTRVLALAEERLAGELELETSDPELPEIVDTPDHEPDADARIAAAYTAARDDTDRKLLNAIAENDSIADAARSVGLKPATARKRLERLRKRLA